MKAIHAAAGGVVHNDVTIAAIFLRIYLRDRERSCSIPE